MVASAVKAPLRALPQPRALALVRGDAHLGGAAALEDRAHRVERRVRLLVAAVDLHQQQRLGIAREAQRHVALARLDHDAVHHLERGRDDARADDLAHRLAPPARTDGERREQRLGALGQRQQPHRHRA